jgi:hypothetical protein
MLDIDMEFSHWRGDLNAARLKNAKSSARFHAAGFTFRQPCGRWRKPGGTSLLNLEVPKRG